MSPTKGSAAAAPPEVLETALKEAERVVKKQKTCATCTSEALSRLIALVGAAQERVGQAECDPQGVLQELWRQVERLDAAAQMTSNTKDLHGAVAKLGKAVDRGFSTDICGALRDVPMDSALLDEVVAQHLYHEGAFEVGDCFVAEAGVQGGAALKAPYASMHAVLEQLRRRNLAPAAEWAWENAAALRGPAGAASNFEFAVHQLAFLQVLAQQGQGAALQYARANLLPFQHSHLAHVQRLMGALCFARRVAAGKGPGPYADLFSDDIMWAQLSRDFVRQSCALLGQAQDSPLLVSVAAGAAALPTLLKLASVVSVAGGDLGGQADELPVEVPLGREFVFRSIFACPVSREQSTPENPPMMLPCGHCMCRHTIAKIAKSATRAFKCPYCPVEATMHQCVELHLPET